MRACAFCRGHFLTGAVSSKMQPNTGTCTLFRLRLGKKMQKKLLNLFCISFSASAPRAAVQNRGLLPALSEEPEQIEEEVDEVQIELKGRDD